MIKKNNHVSKTILFISLVLLLIIPISAQSVENHEGQVGDVEMAGHPEKEYAKIYVIRYSDLFLFEKFYVYVDRLSGPNRMGYTKGRQHIYFSVLPGKHKIISEGKNRKFIIVDVKKGESVYIQQNPRRGGVGTNQDSLELLDSKEGKYFVGLTTPGVVDIPKTDSTFGP